MKDKQLIASLKKCDEREIVSDSYAWQDRSNASKFYYLSILCSLSYVRQTQKLVEKHKKELQQLHLYNLLKAFSIIDADEKGYSPYFFQALSLDAHKITGDLVQAQFNYLVAYIFLCTNGFDIAEEYYRSSLNFYKTLGVQYKTWLCQNNINLCRLMSGDMEQYRKGFPKILSLYNRLDDVSHLKCSAVMIWQLFYTEKDKEAQDAIQRAFSNNRNEKNDENLKFFERYVNYCRLRFEDNQQSQDNLSKHEKFVANCHLYGKKEICAQIVDWEKNLGYVDRTHFIDLILGLLYKKKKYSLVLEVFDFFEKEIFPNWRLLIFPRNLFTFPILASIHLQRPRSFQRLYFTCQKTSPSWQVTTLDKMINIERSTLHKKIIFLDTTNLEVKIDSKIFDFKRRKKGFHLLKCIAESRGDFDLKKHYRQNKSKLEPSVDAINTLKILSYRTFQFLDLSNEFSISGDRIKVQTYQWKLSAPERGNKSSRKKKITDYLAFFQGAVSAQQIADHLQVTKRTITSDLQELIEKKKIIKVGQKRSSLYKVRK